MGELMLVLGINAYHGDAAACLVRDGEVVAAVEEERFRRIKHWAGFPSEAVRYCLAAAGASIGDVDHIAINGSPRAHLWRRLGYAISRRPDVRLLLDRLRNQARRASLASELDALFPGDLRRARLHSIEHHEAHLASAYLVSGYDRAVALSVDGFGDFASAAWGVGENTDIHIDGRVWFPHSLGIFYQAMTQYLGFPHYGDEYKVMGLAPYGVPRQIGDVRKLVQVMPDGTFALNLRYFRHHVEAVAYQWQGGTPDVGTLFAPALIDLLGAARAPGDPLEQRHRDLAACVQAIYEEVLFHLLTRLHERYRCDHLVLAGGCAMNSVANGKIRSRTGFKHLHVPAAAGDAGGAVGAALSVWCRESGTGTRARCTMANAYLGPGADDAQIASLLDVRAMELKVANCSVVHQRDEAALCAEIAVAIARGEVVGWYQGRSEWGPRALGNRSILGDPRRADMKDILNAKIKRRESFRPFAPSILADHVGEWFEGADDVPFMSQVLPIRAEKRTSIPAVTHVDGTGRLQTVTQHANPRYWRLIEAFRAETGVPMVLNTSFNENEPIVAQPAEALDCFLRTRMDVLVLGDHIVRRGGS